MKIGEEDELMLELSIGGMFEKPKKSNRNGNKWVRKRDDRIEDAYVQSTRRRIQALRRRKWVSKREEKMKKPVDLGPMNPHGSSASNPHCKLEPSIQHQQQQQACFLARMPCVSTTGNGPNGKSVSGFLYGYTKGEVSIVCVCHGHLFTPAGFVEHSGGVDVSHPLKHITIFPTAFAS